MSITSNPIKILLIGAECTGKSTLATALARQHQGVVVPEYLRQFLELQPTGYVCGFDDILPIAHRQIQLEHEAVQLGNSLIICDTSPILLAVYSQWYFGRVPDELWALITQCHYDHIFVTDEVGIDWVADGQRDLPHGRHLMRDAIIQMLQKLQIAYMPITGTVDERRTQVATVLELAHT